MLWKILTSYTRPYRGLLAGVVTFQLVQSLASLYLPGLNADIIDQGIATGDTAYILRVGLLMLGVTVIQIAAALVAVYLASRAAMGVGRDLRRAAFRKVGDFSEQEMQKFGTPSLITRSTNDVQQVQMLVLMGCTMLVTAPIQAAGGVFMALQQDVVLSWVLAVAVPIMLALVTLIVVRMSPLFQAMQRRIDQVNSVLREQLTGIRVIRAFVREKAETDRFGEANEALTKSALDAGRLFALVFPIVTLVLNGSSVAVMWFGASRIQAGDMQVGSLTAFLTYLAQILMAILMATGMAMMLPRAAVSGGRIGELLETDSSVTPPQTPSVDVVAPGSVEFDHVTFTYPGAEAPVLHDVSFTVPAGTTTAIIGATGSGKTTIMNLVARLFDATEGTVKVGGTPVRDLDEPTLYSQLAMVPQKPYLFAGTVASNLRYGNTEATDDELLEALDIAQAAGFVAQLAGGLEAPVAQGGSNVSGGQRQRLAIARGLVRRAPIMLLDDSFSALDTRTDARLRQALGAEVEGLTRLVVAQRVASIADADQILVLDGGRITARGTHEELLESSQAYAEIVNSQFSVEEAA